MTLKISNVATLDPMDEVPWLDDKERQAWMAFVTAMHHLPEVLDRQLKRDSGMTHSEYMILAMLSESEDRTLTMTRLAWMVRFSASRLSHTVAKLEGLGLVRRHKDPGNGRVTLATLTDRGFDVLDAAAPGHVRQVRSAVFDQLTEEQITQFRDILRDMLAGPQLRDEGA
jgi:DNA-binding MarR family transcriptional regulator